MVLDKFALQLVVLLYICIEEYQLQGPSIATNVYAWSLSNGLTWPFDYNCIFILLGIIQLLQTYCIIFLDDSANHSTPSIRIYVKDLMKKRDIELQEIKQEENINDEKKDMNNNETVNISEKKEEQSIQFIFVINKHSYTLLYSNLVSIFFASISFLPALIKSSFTT